MPDVKNIGGNQVSQTANAAATEAANRVGGNNQAGANQTAPVGQPGTLGQPTGLPVSTPLPPGGKVLSDVLAGRDPSQQVAADKMRNAGGASATDELLGLNRQPSMLGALHAPPGNAEALRHMTPTMRRNVMRGLLEKQRERMRTLAGLVRRDPRNQDDERDGEERREELYAELANLTEAQTAQARSDITRAARMVDLLEELLAMQDYTISQTGTFSQG